MIALNKLSLLNFLPSRRFAFFVFSLSLLMQAGCGDSIYKQQSYVFGTLVEVSIYGEDKQKAREATAEVLREFDRLHRTLHAWKPSELSTLNAAFAKGETAAISPELAGVLSDATRLSEQSGGSFDPAIGKLVELWGFHTDEFKPVKPAPQAIARLVQANPRMSDIAVHGATAKSANPIVQVDLGGYAKGYALDRAAQLLKARGVKSALVNIGGNIIALGEKGSGPWKVGIQHPRQPGPIGIVELHDGEAIGTSGDYQRYFEQDGKRYCHIIDPATGLPVQGVQAVTVLIPPGEHAGTLSDAASKPPFIAGVAGWRGAAQRMGVAMAMLIDGKGEVYITPSLARRIEFSLPKPVIHEVP